MVIAWCRSCRLAATGPGVSSRMRAAATRTAREPERRMGMSGQFKARAAAVSNFPPPAPELPPDAPAAVPSADSQGVRDYASSLRLSHSHSWHQRASPIAADPDSRTSAPSSGSIRSQRQPASSAGGRSERRHYARAVATGMTPSTPPPDERPERPRDPDHDRSDADDRDVPLDEPDRTEPPVDEDDRDPAVQQERRERGPSAV